VAGRQACVLKFSCRLRCSKWSGPREELAAVCLRFLPSALAADAAFAAVAAVAAIASVAAVAAVAAVAVVAAVAAVAFARYRLPSLRTHPLQPSHSLFTLLFAFEFWCVCFVSRFFWSF
jgi:hypothetical protein